MNGAAAAGAAMAEAIKASGILVQVEPDVFQNIVSRIEKPLVVLAEGGLFSTTYKYLVGYKGLAFYTKSKYEVMMPIGAEIIKAKNISIPSM
jgi:hypothetical protein